MTTSYNEGQWKDIGHAHSSFVQLVEKRSLKPDGFNWEEIEKLKILLGNLEKPSSTYSLTLLDKFPIPIGLKASDEIFSNLWVVDSNVTDYITYSSYQFNNYNPFPSNRKIVTINSSLTIVAGIGDIQVSPTLILRNVLHFPKLSTNLFFTKTYTRFGLQCDFLPYSLCISRPTFGEDDWIC